MAAGAQHLYDRFSPRGLYRRVQEQAEWHARGIIKAVEPLNAIAASFKEAEKLAKLAESMPPPEQLDLKQLQRSLGGDEKQRNALLKEAKAAIGTDIVGPYMAILEQFAPQVAGYLLEHPEMALEIMEWPIVKKLIQKGAAMLGGVKGATETGSVDWSKLP